jgi:hypothetical protein
MSYLAVAVFLSFASPAASDTLQGVTKVIAASGYLWLLQENGALSHLDLSTRTLVRDSAAGNVVDLATASTGRLRALTIRSSRTLVVEWQDTWRTVATLPTTPADTSFVLAEFGSRSAVLTSAAVIVEVQDGKWRRRAIKAATRFGSLQPSAAWTSDGNLYIGANYGEWGGSLWRVSIRTGSVTEVVSRKKKKPVKELFNPSLNPVTAVVRDPDNGRCVLAAIGLSHMMWDGRILRVCGDTVAVMFQESCPLEPGSNQQVRPACTVPVFGLADGKDGVWAVTPVAALRFDHDTVAERHPLPKLEDMGSVLVSREIPGVLLVATAINWRASLSGMTPLIAVVN